MMTSLSLLAGLLLSSAGARAPIANIDPTIQAVEQMVWDGQAQQLAARHGLSLVNVTWEDTGRSKGSVWGPNISDMTIGVRDSAGMLHPMPVLRFDNFNDVTADLRSDQFWLLAGNERGHELEAVRLDQLLKDTRGFLHDSRSWTGAERSLWAARDKDVLVSAQACFLPVPRQGEATFTPVLYNYQSYPGDPAVLTIVATREGTSIQVIENAGGYMSQPLFFNQDGERAPFVAERLSDWRAHGGDSSQITQPGPEASVQDSMSNVVLVIQVPLKQKNPSRGWEALGAFGYMEGDMAPMAAESVRVSDVEEAVVGHGPVEGPFTELNHLAIERDPSFPVRVTVQFYQATSSGVVTDADVARLRSQIDRVYQEASFVGSLVTAGYTGRPTEWVQPQGTTTATWSDGSWGWLHPF